MLIYSLLICINSKCQVTLDHDCQMFAFGEQLQLNLCLMTMNAKLYMNTHHISLEVNLYHRRAVGVLV